MSNHTPGPWRLKIERENRSFCPRTGEPRKPGAHFRVDGDDEISVHFVYANDQHTHYPVAMVEANARLIAAAPCALAALKAVLSEFAKRPVTGELSLTKSEEDVLAEVERAIAKATGGDD